MDTETPERLLRPSEAATLLGLSEQRLAKLRVTGGGPSYMKLGRTVRYSQAAILIWLSHRSRRSTSDAQAAA